MNTTQYARMHYLKEFYRQLWDMRDKIIFPFPKLLSLSLSLNNFLFPEITFPFPKLLSLSQNYFLFPEITFPFPKLLSLSQNNFLFPEITFPFPKSLSLSFPFPFALFTNFLFLAFDAFLNLLIFRTSFVLIAFFLRWRRHSWWKSDAWW